MGKQGSAYNYNEIGPIEYRSDSGNHFEKTFAYIIEHAKRTGDNGWDEKGRHQQALWELLYAYRNDPNSGVFQNMNYRNADYHAGILDEAWNAQQIPYSGSNSASIQTGDLEILDDVGSLLITQINGKIRGFSIEWEDRTTKSRIRR